MWAIFISPTSLISSQLINHLLSIFLCALGLLFQFGTTKTNVSHFSVSQFFFFSSYRRVRVFVLSDVSLLFATSSLLISHHLILHTTSPPPSFEPPCHHLSLSLCPHRGPAPAIWAGLSGTDRGRALELQGEPAGRRRERPQPLRCTL